MRILGSLIGVMLTAAASGEESNEIPRGHLRVYFEPWVSLAEGTIGECAIDYRVVSRRGESARLSEEPSVERGPGWADYRVPEDVAVGLVLGGRGTAVADGELISTCFYPLPKGRSEIRLGEISEPRQSVILCRLPEGVDDVFLVCYVNGWEGVHGVEHQSVEDDPFGDGSSNDLKENPGRFVAFGHLLPGEWFLVGFGLEEGAKAVLKPVAIKRLVLTRPDPAVDPDERHALFMQWKDLPDFEAAAEGRRSQERLALELNHWLRIQGSEARVDPGGK